MTNLTTIPYLNALEDSRKRVTNNDLIEELMVKLTNKGFCSSRHSQSWRVINQPACPLKVQLEFGTDGQNTVDIIPLSSYTETLETSFPLASRGIPHTRTVKFETAEDIDILIDSIEQCFPR